MYKEIYLFHGIDDESYEKFNDRIIGLSKSLMDDQNIQKLKLVITSSIPPKFSVIPFKKQKIAAVSVFKNHENLFEEFINEEGFAGVYKVDEAIPVSYEKAWNDLEHTPGVCLLTLFKQKPGIDRNTFLDRWHNSHTPLSLKIHPLWNYNRNVVEEKLTANSAQWDGIVEEHFKTQSELLNPIKFFGHPLIMPYRMWQVYSDTKSFLDYRTIETYLAEEVWVKS